MTTTYLGFMVNRATREEFVAPVTATAQDIARAELMKAYPESRYALLTIYSRAELTHVLRDLERWPGLPSKVQPPLTTDLTKVTARTGGLPPLPGQVTATVQQTSAPMAPAAGFGGSSSGMPAWMESFMAGSQQVQPVAQPTSQPAIQPTVQPMMQAMNQPKTERAPQSLIERLKAARSESEAMPIRREPTPDMGQPITRTANNGSVIDILKSMRK